MVLSDGEQGKLSPRTPELFKRHRNPLGGLDVAYNHAPSQRRSAAMLDLADLQWQKGLPVRSTVSARARRNPTASDSAVKAVHECESIMKSFMKHNFLEAC